MLFSCKKESKNNNENTNENKTISPLIVAPKTNNTTEICASFDGNYILAQSVVNTTTSYRYSSNGGSSWKDLTTKIGPNPMINNEGIVAWNNNSKTGMISLKNDPNFTYSTPGYYDLYYLGADDGIYCYQGTNSQSIKVKFYYKKSQATTWDTLSFDGDTLGLYAGQDKDGGAAFYNIKKQKINIHKPKSNSWEQKNCTINLNNITLGQTNRSPKYAFNGYDLMVVGYTKGYAKADISNNQTTYQDWQTSFSGYYENPMGISVNESGEVFAQLQSYTNPLTYFRLFNSENDSLNLVSPAFCAGSFTYLMEFNKAIKKDKNGESNMSDLVDFESPIIHSFVGDKDYYFIQKTNSTGVNSILTIKSKSGSNTESIKFQENYHFVYSNGSSILLCGSSTWNYSSDNGKNWVKKQAPNGKSITYINKINGVYYGMSVLSFLYTLGGTGFSVPKHDFAMFTSSDLENWTLLPGSERVNVSSQGPKYINNSGVIVYSENTNPLGNPRLVYYISNDFGKSFVSSGSVLNLYNLQSADGNNNYTINYYGAKLIQKKTSDRQNNLLKTTVYQSTSDDVLNNSNPTIDANGRIYYYSKFSIYELN